MNNFSILIKWDQSTAENLTKNVTQGTPLQGIHIKAAARTAEFVFIINKHPITAVVAMQSR